MRELPLDQTCSDLARKLAALMNEPLETAVITALQERLDRLSSPILHSNRMDKDA